MQTLKAMNPSITRIAKTTAALGAAIYVCLAILDAAYPAKFSRCEKYTKLLNGGQKNYAGKQLSVVLCGTGPDKNWMNDHIRLQIFSENRTLLAQRTFRVDWDTNSEKELVYSPDHLTYYDASQDEGYVHDIKMPPTWWDQVRTKLPLLS